MARVLAPVKKPVFAGDTEMARRMRELDWSTTPLGPVGDLAAGAATVRQHLPRLRVPDRPLVGTRARDSLQRRVSRRCSGPPSIPPRWGSPARRSGPRSGPIIGPMLAQVMQRGEATRSRDLDAPHRIARATSRRPTSRSRTARSTTSDGKVGGVFCPVHRDDREGHRRAAPAHAARSRGAVQGRRERAGRLRGGRQSARPRTRTTCRSR